MEAPRLGVDKVYLNGELDLGKAFGQEQEDESANFDQDIIDQSKDVKVSLASDIYTNSWQGLQAARRQRKEDQNANRTNPLSKNKEKRRARFLKSGKQFNDAITGIATTLRSDPSAAGVVVFENGSEMKISNNTDKAQMITLDSVLAADDTKTKHAEPNLERLPVIFGFSGFDDTVHIGINPKIVKPYVNPQYTLACSAPTAPYFIQTYPTDGSLTLDAVNCQVCLDRWGQNEIK